MSAVPHSGNECSGMCNTPCDHSGCWQCEVVKGEWFVAAETKSIKEQIKRITKMDALVANGPRTSVLSGLSAATSTDLQSTRITRGALEALADKAGVRMDWNDGSPVFYDDEVVDMDRRYIAAQKEVLQRKVRELEKIAIQQRDGQLSEKAARSLVAAAQNQMDSMASDVIKQAVEETLRADVAANEQRIKDEMQESGASAEDIEAAQAVLGWQPKAAPRDSFGGKPLDSAITIEQMQQTINKMNSKLISVKSAMADMEAKAAHAEMPKQSVVEGTFNNRVAKMLDNRIMEGLRQRVTYKGFDIGVANEDVDFVNVSDY